MDAEKHDNTSGVPSWKRLSKTGASERATRLAIQFMQSQNTKGWDWICGEAFPDTSNPLNRERRTPRFWCVTVRYGNEGTWMDGGASLRIDLESDGVEFA